MKDPPPKKQKPAPPATTSLKDQLQSWKKEHATAPSGQGAPGKPPGKGPPAKARPSPAPRAPAAAKPPPAPPPPPAAPPPRPPSDAELFATAVSKVSADAVLAKYDAAPPELPPLPGPARGGGAPAAAPAGPLYREGEDDSALFSRFVGATRPVDTAAKKALADEERRRAQARLEKRVAKDQVKPQATLDLHGEDRLSCVDRLRAFLGASRAQGLAHVLVVHGKGTGTLQDVVARVLDDDASVAEHCAASPKLGGAGARVVRLRGSGT